MPKEKQLEKDIYQKIDELLTRRNIVIACMGVILLIIGLYLWDYLSQSHIIIQPNVNNFELEITQSSRPFTREKSPDTPEKVITSQQNIDTFDIRVEPDYYYQIVINKEGYSRYQYSFPAKSFTAYNLTPQLYQPVISEYIKFPSANPENNQIYYIDSDNQLSSFDPTSDETRIMVEQSWYGVDNMIFSPNYKRVILKVINDNVIFSGGYSKSNIDNPDTTIQTADQSVFYRPGIDNGVTTIFVFDLLTKKYYPLDTYVKDIAWLDNETIIYEYSNLTSEAFGDPAFVLNNTINTAHYDGSNWQSIYNLANTKLGFSKIIPSPANKNYVLLLPIPFETGAEVKTAIHLLDLENLNVTELTSGSIFDASWSPDGNKILYAQLDSEKNNLPTLIITDPKGSLQQNLNINTLVSKTGWIDNNYVLAAIPSIPNQENNTDAIPANYYTKPDFETIDILYQIDMSKSEQINLMQDSYQHMINIHHIFYNRDTFYWQDTGNRLYALPLTQF